MSSLVKFQRMFPLGAFVPITRKEVAFSLNTSGNSVTERSVRS
jgi:hypothetical protein